MSADALAREAWNPAQPPPAELRIDGVTHARMLDHLAAALPNEGCGLLAVDASDPVRVTAFYPGANVAASPTRFVMDPAAVIAAFRDMDARGWRLGAIVHAHPASPATPSPTDLREAFYPSALMVIASFAAGDPVVRAWAVRGPEGPEPEERPIHIGSAR